MANSSISIHRLAEQLGVSSTTVWRALNGSPNVKEQTRLRVVQEAEKVGYTPSMVARTLARGRTQTLGVLIPAISNQVHASLVRAVERVAFDHGYSLILCDTDYQNEREKQQIELLIQRRVEGVVMIPFTQRIASGREHLEQLLEQDIQVVVVQQRIADAEVDQVLPDNRAAAQAITSHLLKLGHRRIAFMHAGLPEWIDAVRQRVEGFRDVMTQAGMPVTDEMIVQVDDFQSILDTDQDNLDHDAVTKILTYRDRPTAIIASIDALAMKVMPVIRSLGLRIPEDVALVGFDNLFSSRYTDPPLTSVRLPVEEVGRRATELLLKRIEKPLGRTHNPRVECLPCDLVIRRSCGGGDAS